MIMAVGLTVSEIGRGQVPPCYCLRPCWYISLRDAAGLRHGTYR